MRRDERRNADQRSRRAIHASLGRGSRVLPLHPAAPAASPVLRIDLAGADANVHDSLLFRLGIGGMRLNGLGASQRGQALTEFALVFPIFLLALRSVIVLG